MSDNQKNANHPGQQGAPQKTQDMPSSGNSPEQTGATRGTDEGTGRGQDVERSGTAGAGTQRAPDQINQPGSTGDPRRTPGTAEGEYTGRP